MEVDVEHRDTFGALGDGLLRGNRGVVEVAITAHVFARGVMAGRAAQGEGAVVAFIEQGQASEGDVGAGFHRLPGRRGNRRTGVHGIEAELAVDERWHLFAGQIAHWPHQWQGVVGATGCAPFAPGTFEKTDVALAVRVDVARAVKRARFDDLPEADLFDPVVHGIGPTWLLE